MTDDNLPPNDPSQEPGEPLPPIEPATEPPVMPVDEPTEALPPTEPFAPLPDDPVPPAEPTVAMPVVDAAGGGSEPPPPYDPIMPVGGQPDPRWYDNRAALASVIAAGLIGLFLLIGWLVWWSDDDSDVAIDSTTTASLVAGSTITVSSSSTVPPTTVPETVPPSSSVAPTTEPTTTTTTTTTTTVAPTTTTTVAPATTVAATTTVPVVTVPPSPAATVFDIIAASPDLSRLNQLIATAGLQPELSGDGPITLFAPSNPAIETVEAAPGGAELLADPDRLRALLLHHVVPASLDEAGVFAGTNLTPVDGPSLTIDPVERTVDGAKLLVTNVQGANGFLHVVDRVLQVADG